MDHLEFVEKLNKLGISIKSTNKENESKIIRPSCELDELRIKDFHIEYTHDSLFSRPSPLQKLIIEGIDIDEWKNSLHYDIKPENYDCFRDIIQGKIIKRAEDIDKLITVYFQLNHEIAVLQNK